jgi:hypothetical protein
VRWRWRWRDGGDDETPQTNTSTPVVSPVSTETSTSTPGDGNGNGGGGGDNDPPQVDTPRDDGTAVSGGGGGGGGGILGVAESIGILPERNESPLGTPTPAGTPMERGQQAAQSGETPSAVRQSESGLLYPLQIIISGILWPFLLSLIPVDMFYRAQRRYYQLDSVSGQPSISTRRGNIPWLLYLPVVTFFTTRVSLYIRQAILKVSNRISRYRGDDDQQGPLNGNQELTQPSDIELAFDSTTRSHLRYLTLRLLTAYLISVLITFISAVGLAQIGIVGSVGVILTTAVASIILIILGYVFEPSRAII